MADLNSPRLWKGKVTLADLGAPALVKTVAPDRKPGGRLYMGQIMGRVQKTIVRDSPDKLQRFDGLEGNFICLPADGNEGLESGICFLPTAFHSLLADGLAEAQKKDEAAVLEFALACYSVEAKNPVGYSWVCDNLLPSTTEHPLRHLLERVAKVPALADRRAPMIDAPKPAGRK